MVHRSSALIRLSRLRRKNREKNCSVYPLKLIRSIEVTIRISFERFEKRRMKNDPNAMSLAAETDFLIDRAGRIQSLMPSAAKSEKGGLLMHFLKSHLN